MLSNQSADGADGGTQNAALVVENVTLAPQTPLRKSVPIRLLSRLPMTLHGGQSGAVSFEMTLTDVPAAPDNPLHFVLQVFGNAALLEKRVPVTVLPRPVFDGVVAIDFGSSNTSCALVESGREFEEVAFDGKSASSPTVVRYLDLTGPEPEIGTRVKELAAKSERVAASTIGELKQRLGDVDDRIPVRPYNAETWATRTAADYLRKIRLTLEGNRMMLFQDFVLTHPAVCSLRQFRNLHAALVEAFGEHAQRVRFLQEPVAALIPFLLEQARNPEMAAYTVAAFDFGGGTTDMSMVRVETYGLPGNRLEIRPSIRYSRGVRFGGEDLSEFLSVCMERNVEGLLALQKPGAKLIKRDVPGASAEDVLRNRYALRIAADQFKASLSEEAKSPEPAQIILRVLAPDAQRAEDFTTHFRYLRQAGGRDLKSTFLDEVEQQVRRIAASLQAAEKESGTLDIIQLSGKTTYLAIVATTLAAMFPRSRVVRAADPKQCVVSGACLSRTLQGASTVRLLLPGNARRTTSSVGLFEVSSASFTEILPLDVEIPPGGLERQLPNAWFGSERVTLWENLGVTSMELRERGSQSLHKLGTWMPERSVPEAEAEGWTLRLLLKDFKPFLTAAGPHADEVRFVQVGEAGA